MSDADIVGESATKVRMRVLGVQKPQKQRDPCVSTHILRAFQKENQKKQANEPRKKTSNKLNLRRKIDFQDLHLNVDGPD